MKSITLPSLVPLFFAMQFLVLCCTSCDPLEELEKLDYGDLSAPLLVSHTMDHNGVVDLVFDEEVRFDPSAMELDPGITLWDSTGSQELGSPLQGSRLSFMLRSGTGTMVPGSPHSMALSIQDAAGNTLRMVLPFFGPNPQPAVLQLTEIAAKSSKTIVDTVEFMVVGAGNLGGISVYQGFPEDFDSRFMFPALEVGAGDIILLHMKGDDTGGNIDETGSITQATGTGAHPGARDFWQPDSPGLPDSSGILTVCETPIGPVQDGVFYCDKTTESGKPYRSFGTAKLMRRAEFAQATGVWKTSPSTGDATGSPIVVEDAAPGTGLTATRTLCRKVWQAAGDHDTDSKDDWVVCQTGGISLGIPNPDPAIKAREKEQKRADKAAKAALGKGSKKAARSGSKSKTKGGLAGTKQGESTQAPLTSAEASP